jgi:hypothetical protein
MRKQPATSHENNDFSIAGQTCTARPHYHIISRTDRRQHTAARNAEAHFMTHAQRLGNQLACCTITDCLVQRQLGASGVFMIHMAGALSAGDFSARQRHGLEHLLAFERRLQIGFLTRRFLPPLIVLIMLCHITQRLPSGLIR